MRMRRSSERFTAFLQAHFFLFVGIRALPLLQKNTALKNPFVGFYILPHGGVILDPEGMDYSKEPAYKAGSREKAIGLHNAMREASEALIRSKPDVIIFSTPHGFHLVDNNLILSTASVYGSAGWIWKDFTASFDIDKDLSSILYAELKGAKNAVDMLSLGIGQETMSLLWAEVIPWFFIREAATKANFRLPSAIYIGQPSRVNIPQLEDLGRDITKTVLLRKEFADKRIAVVISGDLSHLHSNDTRAPYPFNGVSKPFDEYIVNWAKMDRNAQTEEASRKELLVKAGEIQGDAGHCGYTGLVMLHGMMEELVNQDWNYTSRFYDYNVPTYFGMMVASWVPEK